MSRSASSSRRKRVLFVHPSKAPFIQADIDLLSGHFEVRVLDTSSYRHSLGGAVVAAYHMWKGVLWADLDYVWFADRPARWAIRFGRLLGRPTVVIVGGYEVAKVPEISHGLALDPKKRDMVACILRKADRVLPVDESLKHDAIRNLGVAGDNIESLPTGYDPEEFKPSGRKERMALTVGIVDKLNLKRKGLEVFVQAAAYLPDVKFVLVGGSRDNALDDLTKMSSPNVEFAGSVPHGELVSCYQRARVYCQLSVYEGLPNALCEAMLCECVPVGTRVNGIPKAIGDTGFYVPVGDAKAAAEAIQQALVSPKGGEARERIKGMFSLEKREKRLVEIIEELTR
ncbi:MAG: glycosyltransferase family 4 protein [Candidatus Thermoplasmatota archaeon]|nr:glycosyltransferase family 4 protein [Candidatus Thermoplasmatota archaeon]